MYTSYVSATGERDAGALRMSATRERKAGAQGMSASGERYW
jgi:hypothetical protein